MNELLLIFIIGLVSGLALWWAINEDEKDRRLAGRVESILSQYLRHW